MEVYLMSKENKMIITLNKKGVYNRLIKSEKVEKIKAKGKDCS